MIRKVAEAIRGSLRQYDIIATLSEGRFVMILPQAEDGTVSATARVERAVGRVLETISETREGPLPEIRFSMAARSEVGRYVIASGLIAGQSLMAVLRSS